jgi:hypothetical protein
MTIRPNQSLLIYDIDNITVQKGTLVEECLKLNIFNPFLSFQEILNQNQFILVNFQQLEDVCKQIVLFGYGEIIYPINLKKTRVQMNHEVVKNLKHEQLIQID